MHQSWLCTERGMRFKVHSHEYATSLFSLPHPVESSRALRLVDVDEVGHHAALEQTALSLHANLHKMHGKMALN